MTQQHPITPPPELVRQWFTAWESSDNEEVSFAGFAVPRAAQWGADQELEACCERILNIRDADALRAARRPKPPSLKEQALEIVRRTPVNSAGLYSYEHVEIIRRALEQLDD
jgi:hypothetical protein